MRNRVGAALAALLVVIALVAIFHNGILRLAIAAGVRMTTGYTVRMGDLRLQGGHGAASDVQISRGGDPVLDAARVDVYYRLRDLLPGSTHRFGLLALTIDLPHITLVHHENGTYNVTLPQAVNRGTRSAGGAAVPLNFTIRVRDGSASVIDEYRYYKEARFQRVDRITADVAIDTAKRTKYTIAGFLEDRGAQPIRASGTIDYARGYALHRIRAAAVPIKTIGNYFINSPAARILGGTVRALDTRIYALGVQANRPTQYHLIGSGYLGQGTMNVRGLDVPIERINGPINVFDGGFTARLLSARVGAIPVRFAGGIFNFRDPQFRLGVEGNGDLSQLRVIARFAAGLPIRGSMHIHALIEGAIAQPLMLIGFEGRRFYYDRVPLDDPHGDLALYASNLTVIPFHTHYSGLGVRVEGNLELGRQVSSRLLLDAIGPSTRVPYIGALVADQPIATEALLTGLDLKINARGYLLSMTHPEQVNGFYAIDRTGTGMFGPIAISAPFGGSLFAAFALDRPHGNSAFWVSARKIRLRQPQPIVFPGVMIPQLPPIDVQVAAANIAGTGSAQNVVIGGSASLRNGTISGVPFSGIDARFAGPFNNADINAVRASGPWGTFAGTGSFSPAALVARGTYGGSLEDLRPFIGEFPAQGDIDGQMSIAIARGNLYVQAQNARLSGASIHGVPVRAISGTMAFANGRLRIYSAQAQAAGGTVVAAGSFGTTSGAAPGSIALATTQLDAEALRAFGVPISAGALNAVGTVAPGGVIPRVDAGVVLENGRAAGYGPFFATADVNIANDTVQMRNAVAGAGSTYADFGGEIGNLAAGTPQYRLDVDVPVGDITSAGKLARLPLHGATGSFGGSVRVGGAGVNPSVDGTIRVPVGSINGLGFENASALLAASRSGVSVQDGSLLIGRTSAAFSAAAGSGETAFSLRSAHADLADFNDYFDTGDTLAGRGAVRLQFVQRGNAVYTAGNLHVNGLRYRRLPIGNTAARWNSSRNVIHGSVDVGGDHGSLSAAGTIGLAPGTQLAKLVRGSRYDIHATLRNLDLSTWLPALGYPQLPITGRVDGAAAFFGAFPHLGFNADASIVRGTVGPLPIDRASVAARSNGDRIRITQAAISLPAVDATGSGSLGFSPDAPIALTAHVATDDPRRVIAEVSKKRLDVSGRVESTLAVAGTMHHPIFSGNVVATNAAAYGVAIPSLTAQVGIQGRNVVVRNGQVAFAHGSAVLGGSLPLQLQPFSIGPPRAPIGLNFVAKDIDVSAFSAFLGNNTKLGGLLNGNVAVSGTVGAPRIYGTLGASGGSYVSALETIPITGTVAELAFGGTQATLRRLSARLGGGSLSGSGTLDFGNAGLSGGPLSYAVALATRAAQIAMPQYGSGTFDSTLTLRRSGGALAQLGGRVAISDAVVPFAAFLNFGGTPGQGDGGSSGLPFNLGFNLAITAGKNVAVRGGGVGIFGLNISGTGKAQLTGTLAQPRMNGQFNSAGGTLTYIDHAFRIQTGSVTFTPQNGVIPDVFAVGTTHVTNPDPNLQRNPTGSADITATVSGPVTSPRISFASNPTGYTDQQIIALLLPLGGLVGPIQFTDTGVILPAGQLNGAPAPGTGALLPDILVRRQNGTITIGQEAFNILNAQFATGLLAPIEGVLGTTLGLSDVNLTLDYTGNFGINFRRILAKDFYAVYGTTLGVPVRQTFGFAYQPNSFTSVQATFFVQSGTLPLFLAPNQTLSTNARAAIGQAVQGSNGFTFLYQRLF